MAKEEEPQSAVHALADAMRRKGGVEWRIGINESRSQRVEFMRAKDFMRWFQADPERLAGVMKTPKAGGRTVEESVEEVHALMVKNGLFVKANRKFKRPRPGKKRCVKFPRRLVECGDKDFFKFDESTFLIWMTERPTSPWMLVASWLVAIGVIALCLFPLAPYSLKVGVVYTSAGLLIAIFSILIARVALFAAVWVVTGRELWVLPSLLLDVPVSEAFTPLVSFEESGGGMGNLISRAFSGLLLGSLFYVLYVYSPGTDGIKSGAKQARDEIFDWLDLHDPSKPMLSKDGLDGGADAGAAGARAGGHAGRGGPPPRGPKVGHTEF